MVDWRFVIFDFRFSILDYALLRGDEYEHGAKCGHGAAAPNRESRIENRK